MQKVKGYVFFEKKTLSDVKNTFGKFRFDQVRFSYFSSFRQNNAVVSSPGVFLVGEVNEKYTSKNIVTLFRKLMGLKEEAVNYDLTVSSEGEIRELKNGETSGQYAGIYIKPPYRPEDIESLAGEIGRLVEASHIGCRQSVRPEGKDQAVYIDFFSMKDFLGQASAAEALAGKFSLRPDGLTLINLYNF